MCSRARSMTLRFRFSCDFSLKRKLNTVFNDHGRSKGIADSGHVLSTFIVLIYNIKIKKL